jgi:rhamnogalacturonyl hydrolase YesR
MFTYFFAKAVRKGYLDASYRAVAEKAFQGVLREFVLVHPDGRISVTGQCLVGGLGFGRDGSYRYYMSEPVVRNDPKGNGPFILAGVELARMLRTPG